MSAARPSAPPAGRARDAAAALVAAALALSPLGLGQLLASPETIETGLVWPALFIGPLGLSCALGTWLSLRARRRWSARGGSSGPLRWLPVLALGALLGSAVVALNPGSRLFAAIAGGAWIEAVAFHAIGLPLGWVRPGPLLRDAEFGLLLTVTALSAAAPTLPPLVELIRAAPRRAGVGLVLLALCCGLARWPREATAPPPTRWIQLPAGSWAIGTPADEIGRNPDEPLRRSVLASPVELAALEVTQRQWSAVRARDRDRAEAWGIPAAPWVYAGDALPATGVSWCDAARWLNHWSLSEGLAPRYRVGDDPALSGCEDGARVHRSPGDGYRLPSEDEWEIAARAGARPDAGAFAGGVAADPSADNLDGGPGLAAIAWHLANGRLRPHPPGEKAPNPWGLYDMSGNAFEWTEDPYRADPSAPPDAAGLGRVVRGGSYRSFAPGVRVGLRFWFMPGFRAGILGFRPARDPRGG